MRKIGNFIVRVLCAVLVFGTANAYTLGKMYDIGSFVVVFAAFLMINAIPSFFYGNVRDKKLRNSAYGCELLDIFLISSGCSVIYILMGWFGKLPAGNLFEETKFWVIGALLCFLLEAVVFWNGIARIYLSSNQLGIKWRVIGAVCGMIPVVHLVVLTKMIRIVKKEVVFENGKVVTNEKRQGEQICKTKYPILMVHGVFFRDFRYFNYWGRVPDELTQNGAVIYYGNHQSAASVEECAKELDKRIRDIVAETGCEKVNVIAHSKGGLDMRYALSHLGTDKFVATLTTINTPHRGCEFADYLLSKIPEAQQKTVADTYNAALKKLGDPNPDFMAAVTDLTAGACGRRNEVTPDAEGVLYQSVGSKLNQASGGRFPLNFTYGLVKYFDGFNDGLVGEDSFPWGESYRFITTEGKRGISHGDMIDLNRENFDGFDVREFYVELVRELKERGY
ncbi:MAG: hypothetical protein NC086_03750 [Alistipes sp.]|nr:hypothetical protein [Alistipes sp.]